MFVGHGVHKIGAGSGHTYGPITRSCVSTNAFFNVVQGYYLLFCRMYANYGSTDGDSGAPVYYNPGVPYYEGLQWGAVADSSHTRRVFSPSDFVHMTLNNTRKLCFYCNLY